LPPPSTRAPSATGSSNFDDALDNALEIAECLEILRTANYGTGVQGGYADALVQYGYTSRNGGPMDKAIRNDFNELRDNADDVRRWWEGVKDDKKPRWLSGTAIYKNWQAFKNPPQPPTEDEKASDSDFMAMGITSGNAGANTTPS